MNVGFSFQDPELKLSLFDERRQKSLHFDERRQIILSFFNNHKLFSTKKKKNVPVKKFLQ